MESDPPNFNGSYPLAGALVGKAWALLWRNLSETEWAETPLLAESVMRHVPVRRSTIATLLHTGRRFGVLESELQWSPSRRRTTARYRVCDTTKPGGEMPDELRSWLASLPMSTDPVG